MMYIFILYKTMSLTSLKKVKCICGEVTEVDLWSSVNAQQNPELKELLIAGELNVIKCEKCGTMFYAEQFILYLDPLSELLAFVYPSEFRKDRQQWQSSMMDDFNRLKEDTKMKDEINYMPVILFGLDELIELLHREELLLDEIEVLKNVKDNLNLKLMKISPSNARIKHLPCLLPYIENKNGQLKERLHGGLKKLLQCLPDMENYRTVLDNINEIILEEKDVEFL